MEELQSAGIRAEVDDRKERMNLKIREAQLQKVPYMLIVGDKEVDANSLSVRLRSGEDLGANPLQSVKEMIVEQIEAKA